MRPLLRLLLLALATGGLTPAAGQPARDAADALFADLPLDAPDRRALADALIDELGEEADFHRGSEAGLYEVYGCPEDVVGAVAVDLNRDAAPEVHVQASGTCAGGMTGNTNWVFVRNASGEYRANLAFPGGLVAMSTRSHGFADIAVGGRGFCFGLWRWNGREYDHACNAADQGADCTRPCSGAINRNVLAALRASAEADQAAWEMGEEPPPTRLPLFRPNGQ